jgi:tetratricopeptide (TPR) repeat protein
MKLISSTAIALVIGLSATPAAAQMGQYGATAPQPPRTATTTNGQAPTETTAAPAKGGVKPSGKALKALIELQKAVDANDSANIPAKVAAAQAVATTKEDHYLVGQLQLKAALASKNNAAMASAIDVIASSGYESAADVAQLYMALGNTYYQAKQFDPAAAAFEKGMALNPQNTDLLLNLGEARFSQGRAADAVGLFQRAIQAKVAAGQKPGEDIYKRTVRIAYDSKLASAPEVSREWIAAYPSPDSWHNALAIYRNLSQPDAATQVDILRLARITSSMQGTGDYNMYVSETANQANYGEAKAVLEEGISSGKIKATDPIVQQMQAALKGKGAPTAAELASREQTAKIPTAFLKVGDAYYGAGNYQKAAELYGKAAAAGADANLSNLRRGESLAQTGDKAGATAALTKVSGPLGEIAKYWLVYVQRQG